MPTKTKSPASRSAKSRRGVRQTYARPVHVRARPSTGDECVGTEQSPPKFRINITRVGSLARYRIVDNTNPMHALTSGLLKSPKEAKAALIELIQALKADDFDSYDFT